jgi:hypothetical protein
MSWILRLRKTGQKARMSEILIRNHSISKMIIQKFIYFFNFFFQPLQDIFNPCNDSFVCSFICFRQVSIVVISVTAKLTPFPSLRKANVYDIYLQEKRGELSLPPLFSHSHRHPHALWIGGELKEKARLICSSTILLHTHTDTHTHSGLGVSSPQE